MGGRTCNLEDTPPYITLSRTIVTGVRRFLHHRSKLTSTLAFDGAAIGLDDELTIPLQTQCARCGLLLGRLGGTDFTNTLFICRLNKDGPLSHSIFQIKGIYY